MDTLYISYFSTSVWDEGRDRFGLEVSRDEDEIILSEEEERMIEYPTSPTFSPGNYSYNFFGNV